MLMKSLYIATSVFVLSSTAQANSIQPILSDTDSLKWTDLPTSAGAKMAVLTGNPEKKGYFVVRVKFPANYNVQPHHHVIDEYDTIISGTYYLGTGDKLNTNDGVALTAGSFAKIPAKVNHYGWTKEETVLQVSGIGPWGVLYLKPEKKHS